MSHANYRRTNQCGWYVKVEFESTFEIHYCIAVVLIEVFRYTTVMSELDVMKMVPSMFEKQSLAFKAIGYFCQVGLKSVYDVPVNLSCIN